jgi:hypothetical protein
VKFSSTLKTNKSGGKSFYKNDHLEGEVTQYYENGVIQFKAYYRDGKQQGKALESDQQGNLKRQDSRPPKPTRKTPLEMLVERFGRRK